MAPKIVYGKKRPVARQQSSFTKFLSPADDSMLGENAENSLGNPVRSDWRQQLEAAVQCAEKENASEDGVVGLEKGMEGLRVERKQTKEEEGGMKEGGRAWKDQHARKTGTTKEDAILIDEVLELGMGALTIDCNEQEEVETKKNGRARKAQHARRTGTTKEDVILIDDVLESGMGALTIDCNEQEEVEVRKKRGRPRKALENRNANTTKDVHCRLGNDQKKAVQPDTEDRTQSNAPSRTRKPAVGTTTSKPVSLQRGVHSLIPKLSPEPEDVYSTYVSRLLSLSDSRKIVSFEQWSAGLAPHFEITKIAEASFSEVYRLSARSVAHGIKEESVLKVVALKTPPHAPLPCQLQARTSRDRQSQMTKEMDGREEKDQWKSHVEDVLSEVKLLQNLNHIPGFTVFRDLIILQGRPSPAVNKAWTTWNKSRPRGKKSEFPDPSKKASYDDAQLWVVVEMQDAGTDCEKIMELGGLTSVWEVWDVFWGVCLSVAKAEEACRFEHRDLHLGNICVRSSRRGGDVMRSDVQDALRRKLHFTGLDTTVIDYTLSRADIVSAQSRRSSSMTSASYSTASSGAEPAEADVAYLNLDKDPALFEGDAAEEYQYEIYRYMRGAALYNKPLQSTPVLEPEAPMTPRRSPRKNTHIYFDEDESPHRSPRKHAEADMGVPDVGTTGQNADVWKRFHPKTNLVWAHFLLHKLLNHLQAHNATPNHLSTEDLIANMPLGADDDAQKIKRKAVKLYKVLQRVSALLCPVALGKHDALGSVKELVVLALEERWLRVGDVAG